MQILLAQLDDFDKSGPTGAQDNARCYFGIIESANLGRSFLGNKARQQGTGDFELLVSHNERKKRHSGLGVRAKWYFSLLLVGIAGCAACLWAMFYTSDSEEMAHKLGLTRVANSMENLLELLALPALMFCGVLTVYATQRLYRLYKLANNPGIHRRR